MGLVLRAGWNTISKYLHAADINSGEPKTAAMTKSVQSAWASSDRMARTLLSELASTDLTDTLLHDRRPSAIWYCMRCHVYANQSLSCQSRDRFIVENMNE
jgi:hypothetical protein